MKAMSARVSKAICGNGDGDRVASRAQVELLGFE